MYILWWKNNKVKGDAVVYRERNHLLPTAKDNLWWSDLSNGCVSNYKVPEYILHSSDHLRANTITWNQCHSITSTVLGMWWNIMNLVEGILKCFNERKTITLC